MTTRNTKRTLAALLATLTTIALAACGTALDANGAPRHETLDGWADMMLELADSLRSEAYDEIEYTGNIRELRQDLAGVEAYGKGTDQAMVASLEIIAAATCRQ